MNQHPNLGQILSNAWQRRDAVHIAIIPVEAGVKLQPGQHVDIGSNGKAHAALRGESVGVVDPFLKVEVKEGEFFWLMLNPGSITSLHHEWTHKIFPSDVASMASAEEKIESEVWLSDYIGEWYKDGDYNTRVPMLKEEIDSILKGGGCTIYGREEHDVPSEFWYHMERLTGRTFSPEHRDSTYFSCTC